MRWHIGTLLAGLIYVAAGVVFLLEALDVWSLELSDLRIVAPIVLLVAGVAVIIGSLGRAERAT
ncbi:MAG TPA: hypothetical protein VLA54_04525 [Acidimicrobiia bacterium]|jgi:hypothetical protein|nr:hypothetical protein [Acidimicrobiia bacterium]